MHTPGPWEFTGGDNIFGAKDGHLVRVANVYGDCESAGEYAANARLIAKAPELLELWQELLSARKIIANAGWHDNYTDKARACQREGDAIRKAQALVDSLATVAKDSR